MSRQSKRARFAHHQRLRRRIARVVREHGEKPGFTGVVSSFSMTTVDGQEHSSSGFGALFVDPACRPDVMDAAHKPQQEKP